MPKMLALEGCHFTALSRIEPEKTVHGRIRAYMPQSRYAKADVKPERTTAGTQDWQGVTSSRLCSDNKRCNIVS